VKTKAYVKEAKTRHLKEQRILTQTSRTRTLQPMEIKIRWLRETIEETT
jgi:hypothetical protein